MNYDLSDIVTNLELLMGERPTVKVRATKERRGKTKRKPKHGQQKLARKIVPSRRSW